MQIDLDIRQRSNTRELLLRCPFRRLKRSCKAHEAKIGKYRFCCERCKLTIPLSQFFCELERLGVSELDASRLRTLITEPESHLDKRDVELTIETVEYLLTGKLC